MSNFRTAILVSFAIAFIGLGLFASSFSTSSGTTENLQILEDGEGNQCTTHAECREMLDVTEAEYDTIEDEVHCDQFDVCRIEGETSAYE